MSVRVFVPGDTAAVAVGADDVASSLAKAAQQAGLDIEIIRNGSRGAFHLETLVEVETDAGRIGYGPVDPSDVEGLVASGLFDGGAHPLRVGDVGALPFFRRQTRLTFRRAGITDPLSLSVYAAHGGVAGLEAALKLPPEQVIEIVKASGLRGLGGAGFPAGVKWETVRAAQGETKYVVCNADEGDSGTFADRLLMEADPFLLIEGLVIAAYAVGARLGFIYVRSEYPLAIRMLNRALDVLRKAGAIGTGIDIEIRVGAGAYVCGEETALLESLEGRRGQVRAKPPLPAHKGLFGCPTVVNNVLTLAAVPYILAHGAEAFRDFGLGRSRGTMPIQLAGDLKHGGVFETPFGVTLGELVDNIGGGAASGHPVRAVQVGGPLGAYFPRALFDTPFDFEAFAARGGMIGHGGVVVFNDTVQMAKQARFAFEFCAAESCGKCTPCRIGAVRGVETMDKILNGQRVAANLELIEDLCDTMRQGSLCALGGFTPYPVRSAIEHFPEDFGAAKAAPEAAE